MKKKFLSILIPNYNHAEYLPECLSSVSQIFAKDVEILVIDDGSTDNSIEVIESFQKKDSRIQLVKNKQNKGVNKILNQGLGLISGEYVLGLAADDKILPAFSEMLSLLKTHPEIDLCSSDFAFFHNDRPEKISVNRLLETSADYLILPPSKTLKLFQKTEFWIPGHASIMRTALALKYGGYNETAKQYSDFYLFHKIALTRTMAYIPKGVSAMRIASNSYSARCLSNPSIRRETQCNLLRLVFEDETKDLFARSTLLRPMMRDLLFEIFYKLEYWKFLLPLVRKKMRKWIKSCIGYLR